MADRAWRLAFALTFHAADAEDLLQQTLLVAARKRSRIPTDDPWPWFAAVMHREVRNLRRKNLRHITSALQEASMADAHHGPADAAARNELRQQLRNALQQLPEAERDALVAGYIAGLTQKQAAKALGLPLGTYKKRVREGLASLRLRMNVQGAQATALLPLIPIPAPPPGWEAALIQSVSHIAPAGAIVGGIAMKKIAIAAAAVVAVAILGTWGGMSVLAPHEPAPRTGPNIQPTEEIAQADDVPATQPGEDTPENQTANSPAETKNRPTGNQAINPDLQQPVPSQPTGDTSQAPTHTASISGRVVDSKGSGIEGASVGAGGVAASTQAGGTFRLQFEWQGDNAQIVRVKAAADGRATATGRELSLVNGTAIQGLTLVLPTSASVFGKAKWEGGDIAAGVPVEAFHGDRTSQEGDVDLAMAARSTVTNDEGEYRFDGMPPGNWFIRGKNAASVARVSDEDRDRLPQHAQAEFIKVDEGEEKGPVNLTIPRQMRLLWTLAEPAGGVVQASVVQSGMDRLPTYGGWGPGITPDENGVYMLDWLTTKHTQLRIKAEGFAETRFAIRPRLGEDLDLGELTLDRGETIAGRVEDSSGRGIAGAALYIRSSVDMPFVRADGSDGKARLAQAISDANGHFEMTGIAAGTYDLSAKHPEYADATLSVSRRKDGDHAPVIVVMSPAGVIFGVVSAPREAVEQTRPEPDGVRAISMTEPRIIDMVDVAPGYAGFLGKKGPHFAALEDGAYELTGMPPGRWMVVAYRSGSVDFRMDIEVEPGRRTRVDFDFSPRTGTIAGVATINGYPAPDVELVVPGANGRITRATPRTRTDSRGAFRFENILAGQWYVLRQVEAVGMDPEVIKTRRVEVPAGGEVVLNIDLTEKGKTLQGLVTLGGAPHYKRVHLLPAFAGASEKQADIAENGEFTCTLEPGTWHAWFRGGSLLQLSVAWATIEVSEDTTDTWRLNFSRAPVTITSGLETLTEGTRFSGELLGGGSETSASRFLLPLAAGGPTVLSNFVPGHYRFVLEVPGYAPVIKEVQVTQATEVDLTPSAEGGVVTVKFEPAAGFSAEELKNWHYGRVWIEQSGYDTDKKVVAVRENYQAQVKFESLQIGAATLHFAGDAFEPQILQLTVEAGAAAEISLKPHKGARAVLKASAAITVPEITVTDATGREVAISESLLNDARALAEGKLQIGPLAAGTYRATIKGEGEPMQVEFSVTRGQELEVPWPHNGG